MSASYKSDGSQTCFRSISWNNNLIMYDSRGWPETILIRLNQCYDPCKQILNVVITNAT